MQAKYRNFAFYRLLFVSLKFVGAVFCFSSYDLASASIISSHVITESSKILAKYFSFSEIHVLRFQI